MQDIGKESRVLASLPSFPGQVVNRSLTGIAGHRVRSRRLVYRLDAIQLDTRP